MLLAPIALHAPDGLFAPWLALLGWVVLMLIVALAIWQTRQQLGERQVPLMGIIAATIFAGQMINFTIPGGTSGHLLGGTLAAVILGPWGGVLVMTAVVITQSLLFQDGGLLALGLNTINMGVITAFSGYFTYRLITRLFKGRTGLMVGAALGGWLSVVLTAAFTAIELTLSDAQAFPLGLVFPAMVGVHALIGIGEGVLTVFALSFISTTRPDLLDEGSPGQWSAVGVLAGLIAALVITLFAPLASSYEDGLERIVSAFSAPEEVEIAPVGFDVPEEQQFSGDLQDAPYEVLPDYSVPFLGEGGVSTVVAGMIGVVVVFGVAYGAAWFSKRGRSQDTPQPSEE